MQTRQEEKLLNTNRHYSLRKLSVGLASVLIGISFLNGTKTTVKADTIAASTKTGEVSKADNLEVAGDSKDLSAFSMYFNRKNGENETAKADTTSDQTMQTGDQAEAKNQENRLVDQINYKLTKNDSVDSKEDLGQNLTVPDETKQVPTTKSDAEKNITVSSSDQHVNNQLNNRVEGNSQAQPQNSLKLAKRMLTTNLITTPPMTNGGFDEATWGKLDVTKWRGSVQDGVYQLTGYTGDKSHIIVPNKADFEKAGKSTNGLQVGIIRDTVRSFLSNRAQTIAFSKTKGEKVKAIGTDWSWAFSSSALSKFDGSSLDVSNVTDMNSMFGGMFMFTNNSISDLTSLANWNTSKVTDMSYMFNNNEISDLRPLSNWDVSNVTNMRCMLTGNEISDLRPLANWDTSNVTNMGNMFAHNKISNLRPLSNWKTSKVTDMSKMFANNKIGDLTSLSNWDVSNVTNMSSMFTNNSISNLTGLANWNVSNVTHRSGMFTNNPDLIDLKPIANWNISSASPWSSSGLFKGDTKLDLTNINNTKLMQGFLKIPIALQSTTFITNNAHLVKIIVDQDLPTLTDTAKRTIVFNFPDGTSKTVTQTIYYEAIAPVQIYWPAPPVGSSMMAFVSRGTLVPYGPDNPTLVPYGPDNPTLVPYGPDNPTLVPYDPDNPNQATPDSPDSDNPYSPKIIKTYPLKASDWQLDDTHSKDNLANSITVNGQVCFKPVQIPRIDGYKAYLMKDPVNPAMFLVSFVALPQQLQNNQSNNVQLPQKPAQPEQKQSEQKQSEQKQSEQKQSEQKPAQPIQTRSADAKQVDQIIDHISYVLMHNDSTFDNVNSFEPVQDDSASLEASSDSTQKDDATKIVNAAKPKKHIVKKHVVKRHKKHAKKYHLKRRSRKHTKRSRHAKKRVKHRKSVLRKFRKYNLKHVKKA